MAFCFALGRVVPALVLAMMLSACGGDGYGGGGQTTYSVAATVNGLKGTVVVQGSGVNDIQITTNGSVTLAAALANGVAYDFSVKALPTNPPQLCTLTNGSGVIRGNVSNVRIDCRDALDVTMTSPAPNANNVSTTQPLVLTFNLPLDQASLTPAQFHLGPITPPGNGNAVPFTLAITDNQVTLTPTSSLQPDVLYLFVMQRGAVRGIHGEELLFATFVLSFRTETRLADGAIRLRFDAQVQSASMPPVAGLAVDSQGNATAVWNQFGAQGQSNIWSSRYESATGWSTPVLIDPNDAHSAQSADVAVDSDGNALAVWRRFDGTCANIFSNRFVVGKGWGTPVLIEPDHCDAREPRVAVSAAGDAIAVWSRATAGSAHLWGNRFVPGSGWGTVERIDSDAGDARAAQPGIDRDGNAVVVWEQFDGTRQSIWANRYVVGTGWATPRVIEANDASDAQAPQLIVDAVGNALAVWQQADAAGEREKIWANIYRAGDDWGTAQGIGGGDAGDASHPHIAIRNGKGFAVWQQAVGARTAIVARRYANGSFSNAADAFTVVSDFATSASLPRVAVDSQGNAVVVWNQQNALPLTNEDVAFSAMASEFTPAAGWSAPRSIEAADEGSVLEILPLVVIGENDAAFAAWDHQNFAGTSIWAKRFH